MTSRRLAMAALLGLCPAGALSPLLLSASPSLAETLTAGAGVAVDTSAGRDATSGPLLANYSTVPLHFEANQGQTDSRVKFLARGGGYTLFLTANEAVLVAAERAVDAQSAHRAYPNFEMAGEKRGTVLRMQFVGARSQSRIVGHNKLPAKSHYLLGNDPKQWRTELPTYGRVQYREIYPGIDLVFYGRQGQLEYDFVVAPGARPDTIRLHFEGAHRLEVDALGDLVLHSSGTSFRLHRPIVYQEVDGSRKDILGEFRIEGEDRVGFRVAAYNANRPLIIDPVLSYSTYIGGSGSDASRAIAVDASGSVYVAGSTTSSNFPVTAGGFQTTLGGALDAFIAKFDAVGTTLIYATYLGGTGVEQVNAIDADASGQVYVTGLTGSQDFPTKHPLQSTHGGPPLDAFVAKLDGAGSALVYSTYLGGALLDLGNGIIADRSGNAYVSGRTASANMAVTTGAFQEAFAGAEDGFIAKVNADGSQLVYLTYIGGSGADFGRRIVVDRTGTAYVVGRTDSPDFPTTLGAFQTIFGGGPVDAFAARLNAEGSALIYSTYLGGSGEDEGTGIGLDPAHHAYVAGWTGSHDFPVTSGGFQTHYGGGRLDVFVTKLDRNGSKLAYSTFLGGSGTDMAFFGLAVDRAGRAHIGGSTESSDFPLARPLTSSGGESLRGVSDAFVTQLNTSGSRLVYSTYLGGSGTELAQGMAVDRFGSAYVSGTTSSVDFPTVSAFQPGYGGGPDDAFVAKISDRPGDGADGNHDTDDDMTTKPRTSSEATIRRQ